MLLSSSTGSTGLEPSDDKDSSRPVQIVVRSFFGSYLDQQQQSFLLPAAEVVASCSPAMV